MTQTKALATAELELCRHHAEMCKVFSHPLRLQILNTLRDREMSVSDLVGRLGVTIGNMSQHLNMMKQRWVLVSRKEGNMVFYRLANPKMLKAFDLIRREPIGADRARKSPIEERIMPLVELENVSMKPEVIGPLVMRITATYRACGNDDYKERIMEAVYESPSSMDSHRGPLS